MTELSDPQFRELLDLASRHCEQQLSDAECLRLNELLRHQPVLRDLFLEYVQLHGQLLWDAGLGSEPGRPAPAVLRPAVSGAFEEPVRRATSAAGARMPVSRPSGRRSAVAWIAGAVLLMLAVVTWRAISDVPQQSLVEVDRQLPSQRNANPASIAGQDAVLAQSAALPADQEMTFPSNGDRSAESLPPLTLPGLNPSGQKRLPEPAAPAAAAISDIVSVDLPVIPADDDGVIAEVNRLLAESWRENGVQPSPPADDAEWVRRVYLTLTGRIPSAEESLAFTKALPDVRTLNRRRGLIGDLLPDLRTAENLSVMWVNLLIGRSNARGVDEDALLTWLQRRFEQNASWMETVGQLIAAEGRSDQNGATNFLLAHLNDKATPATAVTARLFFGQQVHCTQCHDHPFSHGVRQEQFWALNAFFKQTARRPVMVSTSDGRQKRVWELKDSSPGGMTFYETLRGQQKAVLPEYAGERLSADDGVRRREELVRLLRLDPEHHVAQAMVNRMWYHFFGAAFTTPVDDMGPHNPPSHPELLNLLTRAYVQSGYDTRRLMTWIASSDAWQQTSALTDVAAESMLADAPETGGIPLFTRVYARQMLPEQVYDSIRVAIRSVAQQPIDSSLGTQHRRRWVAQFVDSYGTDENDERLQFDGNISQALLLMNGADLEQAIPLAVRTMLSPATGGRPSAVESLERICLSVLSRVPTDAEVRAFRNRIRTLSRSVSAEQAQTTALEDMLWAYFNSSEFIAVH